jgi:pimeloyl-ACP methyl ester carboxylesterase
MTFSSVAPTANQLTQCRTAIDTFVRSIDANPDRREGAYPYYLFHEPEQPIQGTVLIFHGFSAKPHQMWRLADYLFQSGFNVYQASIAGHPLTYPAINWPQVDLKPEIAEPLKAKIQADPILQAYLTNAFANPNGKKPGYLERVALMKRLFFLDPRLVDIVKAIESPNDPDFDQYFLSSHLSYLTEAQQRLHELDAMPGPIYALGLSVGGAVALGLAASRPDRIHRVVAYAPLLKVISDRRDYVNLAGPLDISETGWDPNLRFPLGCFTAADRFGSSVVLSRQSTQVLKDIPTFMVLTENEDAADIDTNKSFFRDLGNKHNSFFLYPAHDMVPHPMVDPTEVSQGMSNRFWQRLYQETYRFLTIGETDTNSLEQVDQDPHLPQVAAVS